jgi:hypothetical protein
MNPPPHGPWRLLSYIGGGSMGELWLCQHMEDPLRTGLLKWPRLAAGWCGGAEQVLSRFHHEVELMDRIQHRLVPRLRDSGRDEQGLPL